MASPWIVFVTLNPLLSPSSIISYNKLQCVQRHALTGLKNLRVLSLHGNQISMIPEGTFNDLTAITHM